MHINSHFAIGVSIASLINSIVPFLPLEYFIIVIFSFICDFDVFFSKYAIDNNHRMLISHSLIPSIILILLGLLFNWFALLISGIVYSIHIIIDTIDWGTNVLFFHKRPVGLKLLITKEEQENLPKYLASYNNKESFFDAKYYKNKICILVEVSLFVLMMVSLIIFTPQYLFIVIFYFLGLYFHLSRHFSLKKAENR
ncbi:MAG: hypothetical protein EU533_05990 [Promethearchaeota archaeon]|nr:MAG: hypothetical protein EU533_05990 [Candidatus Lokiarchaeota archaeon]